MTPEKFKSISPEVAVRTIHPLTESRTRAKAEIKRLDKLIETHQQFVEWHRYLTNGETACGMLGSNATYGYFVRSYETEPPEPKMMRTLSAIEMLIVPEILVPHELRVNIPDPKKPGAYVNTSEVVGVDEIVNRMMSRKAANMSVGSLGEALQEPCDTCGHLAYVIGLDEYGDNDNGSSFELGHLCIECKRVDRFATYSESLPNDLQYGVTDGVYFTPNLIEKRIMASLHEALYGIMAEHRAKARASKQASIRVKIPLAQIHERLKSRLDGLRGTLNIPEAPTPAELHSTWLPKLMVTWKNATLTADGIELDIEVPPPRKAHAR